MLDFLLEILQCPACGGALSWGIDERSANRIHQGRATCIECEAVYPVRDDIAIFLTADLPIEDYWQQADDRLTTMLSQHEGLIDQLQTSTNPADQFYWGLVLQEQGRFREAETVMRQAERGLYTPGYLEGMERQLRYVVERAIGPLVDMASGRGGLVERLLRAKVQPVVATDFSPRVLRQNRRRFEVLGLYDQLSLVVCDSRKTPFKNGSVPTLTSHVGLSNVQGEAVAEWQRISAGRLLATHFFFPPDDEINRHAARELDLETMLFEDTTRQAFVGVGWAMEVANAYPAFASPTPKSDLLGAGIDGLPVADTELTWCVLTTNA